MEKHDGAEWEAVDIPNADPYSPEAWAHESYKKRIQLATLFIAHAKHSFELARKQMALGMGLMDGCLVETMEAMGAAPYRGSKGVKNPNAKLTPAQVEEIRQSRGNTSAVAARFSVSTSTINRIRRGLAWK